MVIFLQFLMSSLNRFSDDINPCLLFPHVYSEYLNGDSFLHPSLSFYKQYVHMHTCTVTIFPQDTLGLSLGHFRALGVRRRSIVLSSLQDVTIPVNIH